MSFPPCAGSSAEFTVKYVFYGPLCLLATAASFIYVTLDGWETATRFEKKSAIFVLILMWFVGWILLPLFLFLEIVKLFFFPIGLLAYVLTKKYYQSYPHDPQSSEIRSVASPRKSSFSISKIGKENTDFVVSSSSSTEEGSDEHAL